MFFQKPVSSDSTNLGQTQASQETKRGSFKNNFSLDDFILLPSFAIVFLVVIFFLLVPHTKFSKLLVNVNDFNFQWDFDKRKFIENTIAASKETDSHKAYKLLEDNFLRLKAQYESDHAAITREQLEIYMSQITKKYPDEYSKYPAIYKIECLDSGCGTLNYPEEIRTLEKNLSKVGALNKDVFATIKRYFEASAISTDKNEQWSNYLNALLALASEYKITGDPQIKQSYSDLKDFINKFYSEPGIPPMASID